MVEVVALDVTNDASVAAAAEHIKGKGGLDALVNNAGGAAGMGYTTHADLTDTVSLNFHGVVRVTQAFLPLLSDGGRVVMVSSAAGPSFVATCAAERQALLCKPSVTLPEINALLDEAVAISAAAQDAAGAATAYAAAGLGVASYGLSKAALNAYAMCVAHEHPRLKVNGCTPGFIETDLTRAFASGMGKTPAEMGMKPAEAGAAVVVGLVLGDLPTPPGQAHYYGSDALRSPLDKYRGPGEPPYEGD